MPARPRQSSSLARRPSIRSTREGSWVVLDDTRSYWLDGVPEGTEPQLASLRDAASSYRAVNYRDLAELRVAATGDARTIAARTRAGDRWSVPIASDDVARVQRTLDVVDLKLGKAGPAPPRWRRRSIALAAFAVTVLAGQAGVVLVPILIAMCEAERVGARRARRDEHRASGPRFGSKAASWLDADLVRVGLAGNGVVGAFAIYTAVRLVRAGRGESVPGG